MKNIIILSFLILSSASIVSQAFVPSPQVFKGGTPIWYFYPYDVDFIRNSQDGFMANGYNSLAVLPIDVKDNQLYIRILNKPFDYFGYTLFNLNGSSGLLNWKEKSNYTNSALQQIPFDLIIDDDCNVELLAAKAVKVPPSNPGLLIGSNVYNFENSVLDCNNGNVILNRFNEESYNESNQTLGILTQNPFVKLNNKYFYMRHFSTPKSLSVLFPILGDGSINFADTSIIMPKISVIADSTQSVIRTSDHLIEQNKRVLNLECLLNTNSSHYCELSEITFSEPRFNKRVLNDQLGSFLQQKYTSGTVSLKNVNSDYVIHDNYYENKNNELVFMSNLIWLDENGNLKLNVPDISVDTHHYNNINAFYSTGKKLYMIARPSRHAPHERMGFDILEINSEGGIKEVGYLHNSNPLAILNALSPLVTEEGVLVFFSLDRILNTDGSIKSSWFTLYGFDAKALGVEWISSTKEENINFKIYPNPAYGVITIDHLDLTLKDIRIVDISGKILMSAQPLTDRTYISTSTLLPGIYIVIATDDRGRQFQQKLFVQN